MKYPEECKKTTNDYAKNIKRIETTRKKRTLSTEKREYFIII